MFEAKRERKMSEKLPINPAVLKWARETAGLQLAEVAHKALFFFPEPPVENTWEQTATPAVLVTAYRPDRDRWSADFMRRKR